MDRKGSRKTIGFVVQGLAVAALFWLVQSCNGEPPDSGSHKVAALAAPGVSAALNAVDAPGARLGVYNAFWPKRTDTELADRVRKLAGVLRAAPPQLSAPERLRDVHSTPFDDPQIVISYKEAFDDLAIHDMSKLPDNQPVTDVGENGARAIAAKTLAALDTLGFATQGQYSAGDLATGHHRRGEYAGPGNPARQYVVEYRFRALRKLNGIDVANNGIVIGITPGGETSSIRIGGVQIDSTVDSTGAEIPTTNGRVFTRSVDLASVDRRFQAEVAPNVNKTLLSKSVMYVMPRTTSSAKLDPMVVYRYSETLGANAAAEPPKRIGYSLEDPQAAPRTNLDL